MTKDRVVEIATQAAEAHQAGKSMITIVGHLFDLRAGGYCARFVRQVHEAALGIGEF